MLRTQRENRAWRVRPRSCATGAEPKPPRRDDRPGRTSGRPEASRDPAGSAGMRISAIGAPPTSCPSGRVARDETPSREWGPQLLTSWQVAVLHIIRALLDSHEEVTRRDIVRAYRRAVINDHQHHLPKTWRVQLDFLIRYEACGRYAWARIKHVRPDGRVHSIERRT